MQDGCDVSLVYIEHIENQGNGGYQEGFHLLPVLNCCLVDSGFENSRKFLKIGELLSVQNSTSEALRCYRFKQLAGSVLGGSPLGLETLILSLNSLELLLVLFEERAGLL